MATLQPLTSARVVCASRPALAALPHVVNLVSDFVDCSVYWTVTRACVLRSFRLLERLAAHEALALASAVDDPEEREELVLEHEFNFTDGMEFAASRGDVELVEWLARYNPDGVVAGALSEAAITGHLEVLRWLHQHLQPTQLAWSGSEFLRAVEHGHLHVVQWLHDHTTVRRLMYELGMHTAARSGDLVMVQWFCGEVFGRCPDAILHVARINGQNDVVRWIKQQQHEFLGSDDDSDGDVAAPTAF